MKIDYSIHGLTATLTLISWLPQVVRHNRCVDAALLHSDVRATSTGVIRRQTRITGHTPKVMRAYKVVVKELDR